MEVIIFGMEVDEKIDEKACDAGTYLTPFAVTVVYHAGKPLEEAYAALLSRCQPFPICAQPTNCTMDAPPVDLNGIADSIPYLTPVCIVFSRADTTTTSAQYEWEIPPETFIKRGFPDVRMVAVNTGVVTGRGDSNVSAWDVTELHSVYSLGNIFLETLLEYILSATVTVNTHDDLFARNGMDFIYGVSCAEKTVFDACKEVVNGSVRGFEIMTEYIETGKVLRRERERIVARRARESIVATQPILDWIAQMTSGAQSWTGPLAAKITFASDLILPTLNAMLSTDTSVDIAIVVANDGVHLRAGTICVDQAIVSLLGEPSLATTSHRHYKWHTNSAQIRYSEV